MTEENEQTKESLPQKNRLEEGWQPEVKGFQGSGPDLDLSNPPQGGSGVPANPPAAAPVPSEASAPPSPPQANQDAATSAANETTSSASTESDT